MNGLEFSKQFADLKIPYGVWIGFQIIRKENSIWGLGRLSIIRKENSIWGLGRLSNKLEGKFHIEFG